MTQTFAEQLSFYDEKYWHLVGTPDPRITWILYNNIRLSQGVFVSNSVHAENPAYAGFDTLYSFTRRDDKKELLFEDIRKQRFKDRPSRYKTIYVFDDYANVERALSEWYSNEKKIVHECRLVKGSIIHKGDTEWLNASPEMWQENAVKYWSGEKSSKPFSEVIVHGAVYFPAWETFQCHLS